jgi:hypothetical protein
MSHRLSFLVLVCVIALGMSACGGSGASSSSPTPPPLGPTATVTGVAVAAPASSVTLGTMLPLEATATYSDGTSKDVTAQATWVSSNPAAATVSTMGVVSPVTLVSSVTITATLSGKSGQTMLAITSGGAPGPLALSPQVHGLI